MNIKIHIKQILLLKNFNTKARIYSYHVFDD